MNRLNYQHPRILAVEDHPIERKLLVLLGEALGFKITVVSSGEEALQELSVRADFAVVLMDWCMPGSTGDGMDGLQCTRVIRERETITGGHTAIIGVTANAMLGHKKKCLEAGMDDYLSKPYTAEQFGSKILKWINLWEDAKTAG
jgi:CheY-like chemotaxis protein